jgi:hypothetical protein
MIGILLSETFELFYTLGKATYDGSAALYKWYYEIEDEEIKDIKKLENKVEEMEKQLIELNKKMTAT